jgi:hypothetical protein
LLLAWELSLRTKTIAFTRGCPESVITLPVIDPLRRALASFCLDDPLPGFTTLINERRVERCPPAMLAARCATTTNAIKERLIIVPSNFAMAIL